MPILVFFSCGMPNRKAKIEISTESAQTGLQDCKPGLPTEGV